MEVFSIFKKNDIYQLVLIEKAEDFLDSAMVCRDELEEAVNFPGVDNVNGITFMIDLFCIAFKAWRLPQLCSGRYSFFCHSSQGYDEAISWPYMNTKYGITDNALLYVVGWGRGFRRYTIYMKVHRQVIWEKNWPAAGYDTRAEQVKVLEKYHEDKNNLMGV